MPDPTPLLSLTVNVFTQRRADAIAHVAAKNGMDPVTYMNTMVENVGASWESEMDRDKLEEIRQRAALATSDQIAQLDTILPPLPTAQ